MSDDNIKFYSAIANMLYSKPIKVALGSKPGVIYRVDPSIIEIEAKKTKLKESK